MFFFIAGVQPKTRRLEDHPRICPSCGLARAYLQRIDHYLSLFFIPLFPIKKGDPLLICERCGVVADEMGRRVPTGGWEEKRCPQCGQPVEPQFSFCPRCGHSLSSR